MKHVGRSRLGWVIPTLAGLLLISGCGDDPLPVGQAPPSTSVPAPADSADSTSATESPPAETTPAADTTSPPAPVAEWVNVTGNLAGLESYCGNLSYVSARPGSAEVLVNVVGQGMFSNDGSSGEWLPVGGGSATIDHRTSSIVYDPDNPDRFWESGYFGLGPPPDPQASSNAYRTDDGGATFVALAVGESADGISVDFTDPERQTLLLGLRAQERVLSSTDGGRSWMDASSTLPSDLGEASFPLVIDAQTFLLGSHRGDRREGANPGIFRTTDAGGVWAQVFDRGVAGQPLRTSDGGIYWVLEDGGVVGSTDGGTTWNVVSDGGPGEGGGDARRNGLVEMSDGSWLSMNTVSMLVSSDLGVTWETLGEPLPSSGDFPTDGFTYSASQGAVYTWKKWCDFNAGVNPVLDDAIHRLDLVADS